MCVRLDVCSNACDWEERTTFHAERDSVFGRVPAKMIAADAAVTDAPTSALASAPPEPDLQEVDSIVAAAVAAAEAELQAVEEGTAPVEPGAEIKLATFEEEDVVASLMSNPASQRSGVALTNWERFARPVELVILAGVMLLLVVSRDGLDWARVGAGMSGLRVCVRLESPQPRCAPSCALL